MTILPLQLVLPGRANPDNWQQGKPGLFKRTDHQVSLGYSDRCLQRILSRSAGTRSETMDVRHAGVSSVANSSSTDLLQCCYRHYCLQHL
jgi:hypothetical protein